MWTFFPFVLIVGIKLVVIQPLILKPFILAESFTRFRSTVFILDYSDVALAFTVETSASQPAILNQSVSLLLQFTINLLLSSPCFANPMMEAVVKMPFY